MTTSKDSERFYLHVTAGLHRGARVELRENALLILGAGADNDICLSDSGLAERHCALSISGNTVTIRRVEGDLRLNGRDIATQTSVDAGTANRYELSPSEAQLCIATDASIALEMAEKPATSAAGRARPAVIAGAGIAIIAVAALSVSIGRTEVADVDPVERTTVIEQMVTELGLDDEVLVDDTASELSVHGTLTPENLETLKRRLAGVSFNVTLRVATVEQLLEQVRGVFRTNGYTARLSYGGAGSVVVENLDGDDATVKKVAAFVRSDVATLRSLEFAPTPAPQDADPQAAVYLAGPGKRLTTIVDGETAYIATEDGARYFVGSTLPGGHTVRQITAQGVEVLSNETISWLKF